jgi:putative transposase
MIADQNGMRAACTLLGASRSTMLRKRSVKPILEKTARVSHRALSHDERQNILGVFHSERFCDMSAREVYATSLDEGNYFASIPTLYRILKDANETQERRRIATHPTRVKPELMTIAPNTLWSWDISKIAGPAKWQWYHLYMILDVFSRYVVGWRIEDRESGAFAEEIFTDAVLLHDVDTALLTIHADNGAAMIATKTLGQFMIDLGIKRSHSRPHTSNDNPFSEAQFKTLKYSSKYPERFENIAAARAWMHDFVLWYNHEHRHSGIALLTPADVHFGRVTERRNARRIVLHKAYAVHPERFVGGSPEPLELATAVYINPPEPLT